MYHVLFQFLIILLRSIQILLKSKKDLILENISLRQQLAMYNHLINYLKMDYSFVIIVY